MDWLNYAVLLLYVIMMVVITYYTRNSNKTSDDFMLAGRGLGGWMSAFAYGTTYFSAVIFIGYAGKFGWNFGLAAVWVGIGNAVIGSYLPWKVLARRTRNITNKLNVSTMPGFFKERFLDKNLKLVSAIIIFVFLLPYSASVYQGLGYIFEMVFHIDFIWCIIIMAALTALYLFFGGYLATAITDFVQGIIMIVGVVIMVAILVLQPQVNYFEGLGTLIQRNLGFIPGGGNDLISSAWFNLLIIVLLTSFGVWALPQVIHKFYAVKNEAAIKKALIVSTLFALIVGAGAYFVGSLGNLFLTPSEITTPSGTINFDIIVPTILTRVMPAGFMGLIIILLLSASMSTLSSLALTGSSSIAIDIYKGHINEKAEDKKVKFLLKLFCLIFVVISAILAILNVDAIVTMMSLSWGTLAGCFIGPYIYGIYSKKITAAAVWTSLISGVTVTFILVIVFGLCYPAANMSGFAAVIKGGIDKSPLIGVIAMAFSMILTPIVSRFTKKPDEAKVNAMFEGIDKKIN